MLNHTRISPFDRLFLLAIACGMTACANSPTAPTDARGSGATSVLATLSSGLGGPVDLAECLSGSGQASCFSGAGVNTMSVAGAPITSAPVLNNSQPLLNTGSTVTLSWTAPASGVATTYIVEASSAPGGPANLASLNTGNPSTTLVVPNVPAGTYYVRVRGVDASGAGAPSNEVQVVVGGAPPPVPGGSCPSGPRNLTIATQNGAAVTFVWQAPLAGTPTSYVLQAGSFPTGSNLANVDTGNAGLTLTAPNVPSGVYYVRVYARSNSCATPGALSLPSNEVLLTVGGAPGWSGQIMCRTAVTGPNGYRHDETQTWTISGPGQTVGPRTFYPLDWSAQGSGAASGRTWTINSTFRTDLTVTTIASTGLPSFDRTTTPIVIPGGIVSTPSSFELREIDFPPILGSSPGTTFVSGNFTRPSSSGDSPLQIGGSTGTVSCNWSFTYR